MGFPRWCSGKEFACQCRNCKRCRFDPWARKSSWSRKWQPTPIFLPGKFHGQRSLVGYSPWGCKELDTTERLSTHTNWPICSKFIWRNCKLYCKTFSKSVSSATQSCPTLCEPMNPCQVSLSFTNSQSAPKPMSIESVMPSNHLILCRPLLFLLPIPPSIRVFSIESVLRIR